MSERTSINQNLNPNTNILIKTFSTIFLSMSNDTQDIVLRQTHTSCWDATVRISRCMLSGKLTK